jgi:hypothetical protein
MSRENESPAVAPSDATSRAQYVTPSLRRFGYLADVTRSTDRMGGADGGTMNGMSRT